MIKSEFISAIQKYLENEEQSFIDHIPDFVDLAEEDIARQVQLPHCRKNATTTFISSNQYLTTPPDYLSPYSMLVVAQGDHRYMMSKEVDYIREFWPSPTRTGVPRYFAQFDHNSFLVAPTPSQDYEVEIHYYGKPDPLRAAPSNGTTWLLANCENALLFGTLMQGYIYMKGDQDVINSYKMQFDKAIAALQIIYEGRQRKDSFRNIDKRQPV